MPKTSNSRILPAIIHVLTQQVFSSIFAPQYPRKGKGGEEKYHFVFPQEIPLALLSYVTNS